MHSKGKAHLDLKPENLLFDSNFNLLLADFAHSRDTCATGPIGRLGTPSYNSPELFLY